MIEYPLRRKSRRIVRCKFQFGRARMSLQRRSDVELSIALMGREAEAGHQPQRLLGSSNSNALMPFFDANNFFIYYFLR